MIPPVLKDLEWNYSGSSRLHNIAPLHSLRPGYGTPESLRFAFGLDIRTNTRRTSSYIIVEQGLYGSKQLGLFIFIFFISLIFFLLSRIIFVSAYMLS